MPFTCVCNLPSSWSMASGRLAAGSLLSLLSVDAILVGEPWSVTEKYRFLQPYYYLVEIDNSFLELLKTKRHITLTKIMH